MARRDSFDDTGIVLGGSKPKMRVRSSTARGGYSLIGERIPNWTRSTAPILWEQWRAMFDSDDAAIAVAVWSANRLVKDKARSTKAKFYSIKDAFIRRYGNVGRRVREEKRECWTCNGSGEDPYWGEECERCGGSGIYSARWLYLHEFEVAGIRYSLHSYVEPKTLLDEPGEDAESFGGTFSKDEWKMLPLPLSGLLRMLGYVAAAKWGMKLVDGRYY